MYTTWLLNHEINIVRENEREQITTCNTASDSEDEYDNEKSYNSMPILFLQVWSASNHNESELLGYGRVDIPSRPGTYKQEIQVSKPFIPKITNAFQYDEKHQYYLGNSKDYHIHHIDPQTFENARIHGSFAGKVKLKIHFKSNTLIQENKSRSTKKVVDSLSYRSIDEILQRVRRRRRERMVQYLGETINANPNDTNENDIKFEMNHNQSVDDPDINQRTAEVLNRIRSRHNKRNHIVKGVTNFQEEKKQKKT